MLLASLLKPFFTCGILNVFSCHHCITMRMCARWCSRSLWHICAVFAAVTLVAGESSRSIRSRSAAIIDIPDFTVAISSTKFAGDMQWTYDRNVQAALDAAADAGALPAAPLTLNPGHTRSDG
jgi:hypothetical protein